MTDGMREDREPESPTPAWLAEASAAGRGRVAPARSRGSKGAAAVMGVLNNVVFAALTVGLTYYFTIFFATPTPAPVSESVGEAVKKLAELRAKDREILTTYGPVDPATKSVRIPIDRAMSLVITEKDHPPPPRPAAVAGSPGAAAPAGGGMAPIQLYQAVCIACHGPDGRGSLVRVAMPTIPDLTDAKWQAAHPDSELETVILNGKAGTLMVAMKDKLDLAGIKVKDMLAFMRAFGTGKQTVAPGAAPAPSAAAPAAAAPGAVAPSAAASSTPPSIAALPATSHMSAERAAKVKAGAAIFMVNCIPCHGPDGKGNAVRIAMPPIPDFTSVDWQKTHQNAQLAISIINGKGTLMPSWRGKVTPDQAQDLIAFVRSFGPPELLAAENSSGEFKGRFDKLRTEWDALDGQAQALITR